MSSWRRARAAVLACLTLAGATPNELVLEGLYAKFSASFGEGPARFLVLANPGIPVTRGFLASPAPLARLVDRIPLPTRCYQSSGATYSGVYETILRFSETSDFQKMSERTKVLAARNAIFDKHRPGQPTKAYGEYLKYQAAYLAALDAQRIARNAAHRTHQPVPPALDAAVAEALRAWETQGNKARIEEVFALLQASYDANVQVLFANLENLVQSSYQRETDPPYLPVTAEPQPGTWLSDKGWMPLAWESSETSGEAGALALSMQVKRVGIARPWLDTGIFHSHAWRLMKNGFTLVSSGQPGDKEPGLMPVLITGLLLAKDLQIQGKAPKGPAVGPFAATAGVSVADPQIIAFLCEVVPRSPDPDPRLFRSDAGPGRGGSIN